MAMFRMSDSPISVFLNKTYHRSDKACFDFANKEASTRVARFHQSLPAYCPTPLVNLPVLANKLGLTSIQVKDESKRFDLNAFKGLGASYAMAHYLAVKVGLPLDEILFDSILNKKALYQDLTFVTATDGNHGRAVAWSAQNFGCNSVVFMPKGSSLARLEAIQSYGAQAEIFSANYDDTVRHASRMAEKNGWILLQDTAWKGYELIPETIMQGYLSLMSECSFDVENWPSHVMVQAGVGSLPAAILASINNSRDYPLPKFIVVEPLGAACLFESMKRAKGKPYKIDGDLPTIMAGLACGEPSTIALDILKRSASTFVKCDDEISKIGMRLMAKPFGSDPEIISGESGAVTLGLLYELLNNEKYKQQCSELALNRQSRVLLFSTEGDTDKQVYLDIVHPS
ncbi:MAG: diaminopropionate ammonia-lyase [Candidatus Azotimanducaceae bacterium]|jgi:diaminopropionate ammonia-lyase